MILTWSTKSCTNHPPQSTFLLLIKNHRHSESLATRLLLETRNVLIKTSHSDLRPRKLQIFKNRKTALFSIQQIKLISRLVCWARRIKQKDCKSFWTDHSMILIKRQICWSLTIVEFAIKRRDWNTRIYSVNLARLLKWMSWIRVFRE